MLLKKILFSLLFINQLFAINMQQGDLYKEKQELIAVKDELNDFYEKKELEYQKNKTQLEQIEQEIKTSQKDIQKIQDKNQKILKEIKRELINKAIRMYDKMKPKTVANIFNEMINNGKIDKVFDIIIRMKEKNVIKLMKNLDIKTSALLMEKMNIVKKQAKEKGK